MKDNIDIKGLGIALITPYKADDTIDFEALGNIINRLIDGNVDYLVVLGTTGESALLTENEKKQLVGFVREKTAGRIPLVYGYGGINTEELIRRLPELDLEGFSAILSVAPFYVKPSQEGLYQHYKALAQASPLPLILYNVPGRTGCTIEADTTLRLAHDCANIIGIKEASGSLTRVEKIIRNKPDHFQVVSGDDGLVYPLMTLGAEGVISVVGNAYPHEFGQLVHACLQGNYAEAKRLHYKFQGIMKMLFRDGNPAGIKSLMSQMGLCENILRLPLVPVSQKTAELIRCEML